MLSQFSLEEETRCDFLVTREIKKLWAVEMDLALQLQKICQKHNIKYFAAGGTLLGAVRHTGFIPWDDDMDFVMLMDDFQKFCDVAEYELKEPYFFEKNYAWARIRNLNTSAWTRYEVKYALAPYNLGIFIDIFPLTVLPVNPVDRAIHKFIVKFFRKILAGERYILKLQSQGKCDAKKYLHSSAIIYQLMKHVFKKPLSMKYMDICSRYEYLTDSTHVGFTSFRPYEERLIFDKYIYAADPVKLPFENITVPVPKYYDEALKHQFGDYQKFIRGASRHMLPFYDTDNSFTKYLDLIEKSGIG